MWTMIPSLQSVVDVLGAAFTQPSFATHSQLLLAWIMCLGPHRLLRVAESSCPHALPDHSQRHGFDTCEPTAHRGGRKSICPPRHSRVECLRAPTAAARLGVG